MIQTQTVPGTWRRTQHQPHPPVHEGSFDLFRQIDVLRGSTQYREHGHAARTLVKTPTLRIVLVALARGRRLAEHCVREPISIQVLSGRIRVDLPERPVDHGVGRLMSLDPGVPHDVQALTNTAFLLTLPWEPQNQ